MYVCVSVFLIVIGQYLPKPGVLGTGDSYIVLYIEHDICFLLFDLKIPVIRSTIKFVANLQCMM